VLFLKRIFPKVGNPVFSGRQKGVFLQHLTTARQDDVSVVPVVFSNLAMNGPLCSFQDSTRVIWLHLGIAAFFCCAHFPRTASFSDVGMFPWQ
jgi:hypothetical protein